MVPPIVPPPIERVSPVISSQEQASQSYRFRQRQQPWKLKAFLVALPVLAVYAAFYLWIVENPPFIKSVATGSLPSPFEHDAHERAEMRAWILMNLGRDAEVLRWWRGREQVFPGEAALHQFHNLGEESKRSQGGKPEFTKPPQRYVVHARVECRGAFGGAIRDVTAMFSLDDRRMLHAVAEEPWIHWTDLWKESD